MVGEVRVRAHTRRREKNGSRPGHKAWGDLKTGSHKLSRDLKAGGKKTKKSLKRRENREYYVRGVSDDGRTTSGIIVARDRDEARDDFRKKHPGYKIVQLNERE